MRTPFAALASFAVIAAAPNPNLANLADNAWMVVDSIGIRNEGHTAYSGGAYDRLNQQFLVFGGGHWDGWHNDVLAFDIAASAWKSMYATDSAGDHVCGNVSAATPGMLLSSKLPASRHTYDQIDFLEHAGKMIMWSGPTYSGIWGCSGQTLPADTWLYDWAANKWEYKNTARQPQPTGESHSGAYDPVEKLYYAIDRDGYYYPRFWSYNPDADIWKLLATFSDSANGTTMPALGAVASIDTKRRRLWVWPAYYDIPTGKWGKASTAGTPSSVHRFSEAGAPFIALNYDEANDVLLTFGNSGSAVHAYHPGSGQWETLSPANPPSISGYLYGRFFYNPTDNVFMAIQSVNSRMRTWAYRYKKANGTKVAAKAGDEGGIMVLPNPVTGRAVIRTSRAGMAGSAAGGSLQRAEVYDMRGRKITGLTAKGTEYRLPDLTPGLYLIKASLDDREITRRLVVQ